MRLKAAQLVVSGALSVIVMAASASFAHAAVPPAFGDCGPVAADGALARAGFYQRVEERLGENFSPARDQFRISKPYCVDFTGDGSDELVALLNGSTISSPSPWGILRVDAAGA